MGAIDMIGETPDHRQAAVVLRQDSNASISLLSGKSICLIICRSF